MSQKPACIQCGGTEYVLESGFYFCAECQVQSQVKLLYLVVKGID